MKYMLIIAALLISTNITAAADRVGVVNRDIPAPHHGRSMQMSLMYPAQGGTEIMLGENPVFYGTSVYENAIPLVGRYPVILFSHGWGGNTMRMAWLTAGLAAKGAIVIAVNHPNSTTWDINYDSALKHWTRSEDLSTALNYLLSDPVFAAISDPTRIYATGYSYGGWTALSIAGLKGQREGFEQYCEAAGDGSEFCRELETKGVVISDLDRSKYEASYKDNRIAAVAAIDPGLTWGLDAKDVAGLDVPVLLIGLGEGEDRLEATDTSATGSNLEALLPAAKVLNVAPAQHFTALGVCKPAGEAILKEEADDPVCTDPNGADRQASLDKMISQLAEHFKLN